MATPRWSMVDDGQRGAGAKGQSLVSHWPKRLRMRLRMVKGEGQGYGDGDGDNVLLDNGKNDEDGDESGIVISHDQSSPVSIEREQEKNWTAEEYGSIMTA